MYTFRKPKNVQEALELVKLSKVKVAWDITNPLQPELSEKYFNLYSPIVFVYKNNKLMGLAHSKFGLVEVMDVNDNPITEKFSKDALNDIDIAIKQIELF